MTAVTATSATAPGLPAFAPALAPARARAGRLSQLIGARWRDAVLAVAWPFVLSRVWVALFVYLGHVRRPFLAPVPGGWEGVANWWLNPWTTYDSQWFLRLAVAGYESLTAAVFPFYTLVLRLAAPDQMRMGLLGVLVSNLALAAGLACLYRLTALDYDERVARRAVWLLAFFPTAAVFSAVYNESLFLLLIAAAFLAVRRRAWAWAGGWALLASLTRNSGAIIFLALALEWARARRSAGTAGRMGAAGPAGSPARVRDLAFVCLPLLGFSFVEVYVKLQLGGLLPGVQGLNAVTRHLTWPWNPVLADLSSLLTLQRFDLVTLLNVLTVLAVFAFVALRWRRQPPSYAVLLLSITLMNLTYAPLAVPHTNGTLRYLSTTFPFVQLLALYCQPMLRYRLRLVACAAAYLAVCATFSYLFGLKWFVTG